MDFRSVAGSMPSAGHFGEVSSTRPRANGWKPSPDGPGAFATRRGSTRSRSLRASPRARATAVFRRATPRAISDSERGSRSSAARDERLSQIVALDWKPFEDGRGTLARPRGRRASRFCSSSLREKGTHALPRNGARATTDSVDGLFTNARCGGTGDSNRHAVSGWKPPRGGSGLRAKDLNHLRFHLAPREPNRRRTPSRRSDLSAPANGNPLVASASAPPCARCRDGPRRRPAERHRATARVANLGITSSAARAHHRCPSQPEVWPERFRRAPSRSHPLFPLPCARVGRNVAHLVSVLRCARPEQPNAGGG
jgi:hypothetical protein